MVLDILLLLVLLGIIVLLLRKGEICIRIIRENVVNYKNMPVDIQKQFEQAQEFENLNKKLKQVVTNYDTIKANDLNDIDKMYNDYMNGGDM
jgi:uncharacterized membrane protein (DUF106 family)